MESGVMEPGKYYLITRSWDWTFVGKFVAVRGPHVILDHAVYFIRPGRPFGELCRKGFVPSGDRKTLFSECGNGIRVGDLPSMNVFPWHARVTWKNPDEEG